MSRSRLLYRDPYVGIISHSLLQQALAITVGRYPDGSECAVLGEALRRGVEEHGRSAVAGDLALGREHALDALLRWHDRQDPEALEAPLVAVPIMLPGSVVRANLSTETRLARKASRRDAHGRAVDLEAEIVTTIVRQHDADQAVGDRVEGDRMAIMLNGDAQPERVGEVPRGCGEVGNEVVMIEKPEIAASATGALEMQHRFGGLQRVHDMRGCGPRVLGGPLQMRVDVGCRVDNRAGTFATEAIDEVREGAELQVLLARAVQIAMVEEELQATEDLLAACRRVEHDEVASNLLARHEPVARDGTEYL